MFAVFVNVIVFVVIIILIVWEVIECFCMLCLVEGGMMMVIVVVGLLVNIFFFWLFYYGSEEKNFNVWAAVLYVFGDLLGLVGVIIVVLIIIWIGWIFVDFIFLILVLFLVLCSVWWLLKDSVNELFEGVLVLLDIVELKCCMCWEILEVCNVYYVYVWMVGEKLVMMLYV